MRLLLVVTIGMGLCQPQLCSNLCSETLTDGAGGFLPGESLGCCCLGMGDQD